MENIIENVTAFFIISMTIVLTVAAWVLVAQLVCSFRVSLERKAYIIAISLVVLGVLIWLVS